MVGEGWIRRDREVKLGVGDERSGVGEGNGRINRICPSLRPIVASTLIIDEVFFQCALLI